MSTLEVVPNTASRRVRTRRAYRRWAGTRRDNSSAPRRCPVRLRRSASRCIPGRAATYDGWGNVGGVHFDASAGGETYGTITMPVDGRSRCLRPSRCHLVVRTHRHRPGDRGHFPDPDRLSRSAGTAPAERTGAVRNVCVHGESWGGLERRRRLGGPVPALRHRHRHRTQDHRQRRHRARHHSDDRPRRDLLRVRHVRLRRRRAGRDGRVVPSHRTDSHLGHAAWARHLGAGSFGRRTTPVTRPDHPS